MGKPSDKTSILSEKEETAQWIKEHEDSLDYPDVPEDRGYRFDDSKLSPEVQKVMADRRKQLAEQSNKSD